MTENVLLCCIKLRHFWPGAQVVWKNNYSCIGYWLNIKRVSIKKWAPSIAVDYNQQIFPQRRDHNIAELWALTADFLRKELGKVMNILCVLWRLIRVFYEAGVSPLSARFRWLLSARAGRHQGALRLCVRS